MTSENSLIDFFTGLAVITIRYGDKMRFCCAADGACLTGEELSYFLSGVVAEIQQMAKECNNPVTNNMNSFLNDSKITHV